MQIDWRNNSTKTKNYAERFGAWSLPESFVFDSFSKFFAFQAQTSKDSRKTNTKQHVWCLKFAHTVSFFVTLKWNKTIQETKAQKKEEWNQRKCKSLQN